MSRGVELSIPTPCTIVRADLADLHAFRPDPKVARFTMDLEPENEEQSRAAYHLAVVHSTERRAIGWIGIGPSSRHPDPRELGFGYTLNRDYRGHGSMTEVVMAVLALGFAFLAGRRASAWRHTENRASARVLEKAGLHLDREFEQADPGSGRLVPCLE